MFLVMGGSGSATLNLSLGVDDNPNIKGDSCRSVRIGDVELKRTRLLVLEEEVDREGEELSAEGTPPPPHWWGRDIVVVGGARCWRWHSKSTEACLIVVVILKQTSWQID